MTKINKWAIVPAAGIGSRMGAKLPKQYLKIHDKTVIEWSIQALLDANLFEKVVVAIAPNDNHFCKLSISSHPKVVTTQGGENRQDSVLAGLQALKSLDADFNDWVFVHDAARPCLCQDDLVKLANHCDVSKIPVLLAAPIKDSLKRIEDGDKVVDSVNRDGMFRAFTPQVAPYLLLKQTLEDALNSPYYALITDEISALTLNGIECHVIHAKESNIKITQPLDLELAQFYLSQQKRNT